jgi:peptidoglycan/xylan/chitin deacetylase (PgdA/CDA1 family)
MNYPYIPISERQPLRWPNGAQLALIVTINLETWDLTKPTSKPYYAGGPPILPDVLPGDTEDFPNFTWREYGQRVGVWRLFELLDELEIPASCTANAVTFERRRAMTDAVLARGWELVAHNWEQGELLTDYAKDAEGERALVLRTLEAFERATGRRSRGWLSSSLRGTRRTADTLAEHGCSFYCDLLNDDQPYLLRTPHGPIVSLPYTNEINDFTFITRKNFTTDEFRDALIEEFDVLHAEGARSGRLMNVGLHPHVAGRAHRVRALREFLEHVKATPGVWLPTREEVADWYLANHEDHIPGQIEK